MTTYKYVNQWQGSNSLVCHDFLTSHSEANGHDNMQDAENEIDNIRRRLGPGKVRLRMISRVVSENQIAEYHRGLKAKKSKVPRVG